MSDPLPAPTSTVVLMYDGWQVGDGAVLPRPRRWTARIERVTGDLDERVEIDEAAVETVDSLGQYCLLHCVLVSDASGPSGS